MILTEEHEAIRATALRFAKERLLPGYQQREILGMIDRRLLREMGQLGLIGAELPAEFGGSNAGAVVAGLISEAIAYGDFNIGCVQMMGSLLGGLVSRHAQPSIAQSWTRRQIAGQAILGIAVTEPQAGTDAANIQLSAMRDGDTYVLAGEKTSISFCDQADALIVLARTGARASGPHGVTAFLVPADLAGLTKRRFNDLGHKIVGRGSVHFDDVRVPADHRLGDEGKGFTQVMQGFEYSRILLALMCLAAAQASIDETWIYTRDRVVMGAPIAQYQGVTFPLVEAETQLAACRALCYHGLALSDAKRPYKLKSAMVKSLAPKAAMEAIHQCIATFGHYAVSMDLPHQQRLRDVMGFQFGEGTAQAMKLIVARERTGGSSAPAVRRAHS